MPRCADCGFLSLRNRDGRTLSEADEYSRESGHVPSMFDSLPACYVQAARLGQEAGGTGPANFVKVVTVDRPCDRFVPWRQGFSPKDHAQMLFDQSVREAAERQAREMREWQERQQEANRQIDHDRRRSDRRWQVVTLFLGAFIATGFEPVKAWVTKLLGVQAPPPIIQIQQVPAPGPQSK